MQNTKLHAANSTFKQQTANKADERDSLSNFCVENPVSEPLALTQQIVDSKSYSGDYDDLYLF